jgi:acetyltransferase-like isoleucine patch superfamily enzyme
MRKYIRKLYYGTEYLFDYVKNNINNQLIKFIFYINSVKYETINVGFYMPIIRVYNGGKFKVGKNFTIISKSNTGWYSKSKIIVTDSGNLTIGDNSGMNSTLIFCSNSITIGNNVKIGGGTRIYDTNFHSTNAAYRANPILDGKNAITAPIVIGDNVFIGTNCIISKGITIGSNSIIAAGSVVVKSIPENEIWGGNPAKFIKKISEKAL